MESPRNIFRKRVALPVFYNRKRPHSSLGYLSPVQFMANLFATLILLAFLVHTALDWMDSRYAKVRALLPSRRTFFEHLRALLQYLPFDDWDHLMRFMQQRLVPNAPDTS